LADERPFPKVVLRVILFFKARGMVMAMREYTRRWSLALAGLAVGLLPLPALAQDSGSKSNDGPQENRAQVKLHWVSSKPIEGLTEKKGVPSSCDPDSLVYPHSKPALVLDLRTVSDYTLTKHDFSASGSSPENYTVRLYLTEEARKTLKESCPSDKPQTLTVLIDGKYWGLFRYEKAPGDFVPEQAQADTFTPDVGFFSSKVEAERLVNAVKRQP
jgi:hypothetical protein